MEKIKLQICCGTTCYMLGGSQLLQIENELPPEWLDKVDISASPCVEECVSEKICEAPFVRINGKLYGHATVESVCEVIASILAEEEK